MHILSWKLWSVSAVRGLRLASGQFETSPTLTTKRMRVPWADCERWRSLARIPKTPTYTLSFEVGNHQSSRHPQRDLSCWECCTFRQIKLTVRESIYDRCGPTVPFGAMYTTSTRSTRSQKAPWLCPTLRTYFLADVQPSFSLAVYPKTQSTWRQHNLGDLSIRYQGFLEEVGVLYNWEASSLLTNISSFEINNPAARNYGRSRSAASVNSGNKEISIAAGPAPKDSIQPNRWLMSL